MTGYLSADRWRVWREGDVTGNLYLYRATGELPEMESAKAASRIAKGLISPNDKILDVGCGAGHYLRSLKRAIKIPFSYVGVDATSSYIKLARTAWKGHEGVEFETGDIFALRYEDASYDLVICCNLLLHLPSVEIPLRELIRVARKHVLVRTLIGDRSFRIQEVYSPVTHPNWFTGASNETEFDEQGEPKSFSFFNIYARSYIERLLARIPRVKHFRMFPDKAYSPTRISRSARDASTPNATRIIGGWQVNGYILQPWHFIQIEKSSSI